MELISVRMKDVSLKLSEMKSDMKIAHFLNNNTLYLDNRFNQLDVTDANVHRQGLLCIHFYYLWVKLYW